MRNSPKRFLSIAWWQPFLRILPAVVVTAGICMLIARQINWEFISSLDFAALWVYRYSFWQGLVSTFSLTGMAILIGMLLGTLLAIGSQQPIKPIRWLIVAYVEVFRNTPLVLLLFWIHFALPRVFGASTTPFESGFIAITVQSSAYLADVARTGILAVPKGQWEAANALGLSIWTKWLEVIFPQALRIVVPPLANIAVGYFKASAALALLSVGELTTVAGRVAQHSMRPIETYTVVGLIYLVLGYTLSSLTFRVEKRLGDSTQ